MGPFTRALLSLLLTGVACRLSAQGPGGNAPLPDIPALLGQVEANQKRLEALQRDYTYHVHTEQQTLNAAGAVTSTKTEDAESVTLEGIRVDRVTARNGRPLTPEEQLKESERVDKAVARGREREDRLQAKHSPSDENGNEVIPLSRILELGSFSNARRVTEDGRSLIAADYAGNPQAKTRNAFETILRDVVGTVWIDEQERVLVRGEGHFVNDFKLGGGLLADVQKGTAFSFRATRVADGVWLPSTADAQGSARILLLAHFRGRVHLVTSDYRRFRASATIVGSHGAVDDAGKPMQPPDRESDATKPAEAPAVPEASPHR